MKNPLKVSILLLTVAGLTSCGQGGSSSVTSSSKPIPSSSEPSSSSSKSSSESSSLDPYEGRIKSLDFSIVDLTGVHYRGDDPELYEDVKPVEDYYLQDKLKMYYLDEINDVYFVPLSSFASIFNNEVADGHTMTCEEDGASSIWTVKKGNDLVFRLKLNGAEEYMEIDGELDSDFLKPVPDGRNGENAYADIKYEYVAAHPNTTKHYSFKEYDFDVFKADGKYCYPFALISLGLSQVIERNFLFNSYRQELYKYGPTEQLEETKFITDVETEEALDAVFCIQDSYAKQYKNDETGTIDQPKALSVFNKKLFYFLMDKFYGMAKQKGFVSMSNYYNNYKFAEDFDSTDGTKRVVAYFKSVQMLNDLHSGYGASVFFTESLKEAQSYQYQQTFIRERTDLRTYLTAERNASIADYNELYDTHVKKTDMRYSGDGLYGYFTFDSFDTYHYFEEDPIPEQVLLEDTFFLFIKNLNEAKEKGVKRIIIDDSTNGGGSVAVMGKLLALLSKDNKSEMFLLSDDNGAILKTTTRVDSNRDGVYDEKDCYGNDFEFFILTSNYSYSCGNAFPFYAKQYGLATLMGARSGGGECCVFEYNFPSGQNIRYSSPYHLGCYDEKANTYLYDEYGADVEYEASGKLYNLYDVDFVGNFLSTAKPINA